LCRRRRRGRRLKAHRRGTRRPHERSDGALRASARAGEERASFGQGVKRPGDPRRARGVVRGSLKGSARARDRARSRPGRRSTLPRAAARRCRRRGRRRREPGDVGPAPSTRRRAAWRGPRMQPPHGRSQRRVGGPSTPRTARPATPWERRSARKEDRGDTGARRGRWHRGGARRLRRTRSALGGGCPAASESRACDRSCPHLAPGGGIAI
jgi:hypothetical protein